jgi:hypothetical protein
MCIKAITFEILIMSLIFIDFFDHVSFSQGGGEKLPAGRKFKISTRAKIEGMQLTRTNDCVQELHYERYQE